MSWILENSILKKFMSKLFGHKKCLTIINALILVFMSVVLLMQGRIILAMICLLMLIIVLLNIIVLRKMQQPVKPFGPKSRIRNVDYLVIGDICEPNSVMLNKNTEKISYVQLSAPGRTLLSSYEILRHTFGILKESGGTAILVVKHKNIEKKKYSVFDIPIFELSPITVKRLGLEYLKRRRCFPLIYSPLKSIHLICSYGINSNITKEKNHRIALDSKYHRIDCPWKTISMFCEERGIKLDVWSK